MSAQDNSVNPRGTYRRRVRDPLKHCEGVVDRNEDSLRAKIEKYDIEIAELEAIKAERNLSGFERKKLGNKIFARRGNQKKLDSILAYGPDDRLCMKTKGQGTDHPGVGLCLKHCVCKGKQGGHLTKYGRRTKNKMLQEKMDELEAAGTDLLDLMPEVLMLKAQVDLFNDEKIDFDPETVRSLTLLAEQLRKTVETVNDKRFRAMMTMDMFNAIMARMGEVITKYVTDPEILDRIVSDWSKISVEASVKRGTRLAETVS